MSEEKISWKTVLIMNLSLPFILLVIAIAISMMISTYYVWGFNYGDSMLLFLIALFVLAMSSIIFGGLIIGDIIKTTIKFIKQEVNK